MSYLGFEVQGEGRKAPTGGELLPAGMYAGTITRAQIKDNSANAKDPSGKYLEVEFDIGEPDDFSNRKMWDRFNIINANADAQRIAKEQLEDLLIGLGMGGVGEVDELIGQHCSFYVIVEKGKNGYNDKNQVAKYFKYGATAADYDAWRGKKGAASQPKQAKQPENVPSWKKNRS